MLFVIMKFTVLYCTVLYYTVLYCIVLYCIALHCIALHCILFYSILLPLWQVRTMELSMVWGLFHKGFMDSESKPLQRRHNERNRVSNHQRFDCLVNCLFRRRSKKTSKLHVTCLCEGNSPVTGEFPTQRASNRKCFHLMTSSRLEKYVALTQNIMMRSGHNSTHFTTAELS